MSVDNTLKERGNRYGDFTDHAKIAQDLQDVMRNAIADVDGGIIGVNPAPCWPKLSPVQKQALTVIADKIARILSGDPNYADNWHDIQGYAKLVEDRLPRDVDATSLDDSGAVMVKIEPSPVSFLRSPPWPDDVTWQFMAQDADGTWFLYDQKPTLGKAEWMSNDGCAVVGILDPVHGDSWTRTLIQRGSGQPVGYRLTYDQLIDAPEWPDDIAYRYMAQDAGGHWFAYTGEPILRPDADRWRSRRGAIGFKFDLHHTSSVVGDSWKNTCVERPT